MSLLELLYSSKELRLQLSWLSSFCKLACTTKEESGAIRSIYGKPKPTGKQLTKLDEVIETISTG